MKSGTMDLNQSTVTDNDGCGVAVGAGTLTESGNTFAANENGNICN
ncbi:MAG: hypothetical protein AAF602_02770 [Myxococcota bacterium]